MPAETFIVHVTAVKAVSHVTPSATYLADLWTSVSLQHTT